MAFGRMGARGGFGSLGVLGRSSPLWTSAALGSALVAEHDMSDAATITSSVGTISAITDKSGNGWTLSQATGVNQPAYNATGINGFGGAGYDGAQKFLATAAGLIVAQPNTVVSLFQIGASQNTAATLWDGNTAESGDRQILFTRRSDVADQPAIYAGFLPSIGSALSLSTNYLSSATLNGASSSHGFNGAAPTTINPGIAGITGGFKWSSAFSGNAQFVGLIGYSAIVNRVLTTTERQKLEGYAAWRFLLNQVVLPPSHPYYSARPTL